MNNDNPTTSTSAADPQVSSQSGTSGSGSGYKVGLEEQWQYSWQSVAMGIPQGVATEGGTETGQGMGIPRLSRARRIIRKFRMANQDGEVR
jgi:hypothetical protein